MVAKDKWRAARYQHFQNQFLLTVYIQNMKYCCTKNVFCKNMFKVFNFFVVGLGLCQLEPEQGRQSTGDLLIFSFNVSNFWLLCDDLWFWMCVGFWAAADDECQHDQTQRDQQHGQTQRDQQHGIVYVKPKYIDASGGAALFQIFTAHQNLPAPKFSKHDISIVCTHPLSFCTFIPKRARASSISSSTITNTSRYVVWIENQNKKNWNWQ